MKIDITLSHLRKFAKVCKRVEDIAERDLHWGQDDNRTEFEISFLGMPDLEKLRDYLTKLYNAPKTEQEKGMANACLQKISALIKVRNDDQTPIMSLETMKEALTEYIRKSPEKWLFAIEDDNRNLPYLVTGIKYEPADPRNQTPASVEVSMKYIYLGEVKTNHISYYYSDLFGGDDELGSRRKRKSDDTKGKKIAGYSAQQVLDRKGYILGVSELVDQYHSELDIYLKYRDQIGEQFTSNSIGYSLERYYSRGTVAMNTDGTPHKLVVNEDTDRKIKAEDNTSSTSFWTGKSDDTVILRTPIHMYIKVFNLKNHSDYAVHTSSLTPYEYDTKLIHKLVLPPEVKELIEILGNGAAEGLGDIIAGKAEGIIVGCVGNPGLGKTLSAEVYSEFLKRPLYSVQCAQLGTTPDELEKKLTTVLENAQRWKAVLLLDEADVYIRKRGHDIQQNAIVGVFLRVLEYYRGIIFLTTNLANSIDDAIESRFSAKIIFDYPERQDAIDIWKIQVENHGWPVDEEMIELIVDQNPFLSGRSIRSLVKLSTLLARYRKTDLTIDILKHAAKFAVMKGKPEPEPVVDTDDKKDGNATVQLKLDEKK